MNHEILTRLRESVEGKAKDITWSKDSKGPMRHCPMAENLRADILAACAAVAEPDQRIKDLALGSERAPGPTVIHEAPDIHHLIEALPK